MFVHHSQRSGEGRAVHCEDFSERSLRDVSGERKRLQDRELRNGQSERPQCLVIALAERPSGASKIRAHAGQSWRALHALKMYMHVIAIQKQFEDCEAIEVCIRHVSVLTTERYLGCKQNLEKPVNDRFGCLFVWTSVELR
jgi:hypothetical protein